MKVDELYNLLNYKNGILYRKNGKKAGFINNQGYTVVKIGEKAYMAHRLIFMMHYGYLPKIIDHVDGNKSNNNILNLRCATHGQNIQNSKLRKDNASRIKGVYWYPSRNKWLVQLRINGKIKHFGYFDSLDVAKLVIQSARNKHHGEFANHGF
jgi:hypothetical protein